MLSNEIQKVTGHTTFVGTHSKEMKHLDAKPQYKRLTVKHMPRKGLAALGSRGRDPSLSITELRSNELTLTMGGPGPFLYICFTAKRHC